MKLEHMHAAVECREVDGVRRLVGTVIQEGRAASGGRRELFAPGSIQWPAEGMAILGEHRGAVEARAMPSRGPDGSIRIAVAATPGIVSAVESGRDGLSVEFVALEEETTAGGVREIRRALVDAAALVSRPEYEQGRAELRGRRSRTRWLSL